GRVVVVGGGVVGGGGEGGGVRCEGVGGGGGGGVGGGGGCGGGGGGGAGVIRMVFRGLFLRKVRPAQVLLNLIRGRRLHGLFAGPLLCGHLNTEKRRAAETDDVA